MELSGSSLTTLGFVDAQNAATRFASIVEALLGLAIVALMISFLLMGDVPSHWDDLSMPDLE